MEKIGLCRNNGKPIIGRVEYEEAVLKVNEIVEWIKKHEKYVQPLEKAWKEAVEQTLEEAKKQKRESKATLQTVQRLDKYVDKPKVLRYELSNDGVGLKAYLADGISYHIHSNELTHEQRLIKIQLLGMEDR